MDTFFHIPVMLDECIEGLQIKPNGTYVDCTLGMGGHSLEIAKQLHGGKLICIDKDIQAIEHAKPKFKDYNVEFVHSDFKEYKNVLKSLNIEHVDGVLIDLGISSYQIDTAERGFSYRFDGQLDMKMDETQDLDAKQIVNTYLKGKI